MSDVLERPAGQPETVQLEADWSTQPRPAFSNFVHITQSGHDFVLFFGDFLAIPPALAEARESGRTKVPLTAAVRLPPDVLFATINSLVDAWNAYVTQSKAQEPAEPPVLRLEQQRD